MHHDRFPVGFLGGVYLAEGTTTTVSISREALLAVPREQREAALALGATKWESTWYRIDEWRYDAPVPRNRIKRCQIEPKRRGPYTPEPVQARVVSRHMSGESVRGIARAESIGRDTVGRILSQQEVVETIARYQSRLLDMVPKAIGVYHEALQSDDLHLAAATATKLLEGMQVLHKGGIEQTIQLANRASPESNQEQRRLLMLGQIMDGMLERSRLYDLPLPPDIERVRDELQGTDGPQQGRRVTLVR